MKIFFVVVFVFLMVGSVSATTYYGKTGSVVNSLTNWGTTSGGGGTNPTVWTNTVDIFIIENGTSMTLSAAWTISGTFTINAGGTFTSSSTYNLSAATITINGTYVNGSTGTIAGTMTVGAVGTYQHAQNAGTIPTATWDPASTCWITGVTATAPGGGNQAFGNFTWECSGQSTWVALAATTMSIQGNLTVNNSNPGTNVYDFSIEQDITIGKDFIINTNGIYRVCYQITRVLTVNGNVTINGGQLLMNSSQSTSWSGTLNVLGNFSFASGTINARASTPASNTSYINFAGSGAIQTYTSGGTITSSANANIINFKVNSGAYLQMGTGASPGILSAQTIGGNTFTLTSGATLGVTSTVGITTTGATGNIQVNGTRTYNSGANFEYNGTSAQVTGNGLANNPSSVTISNSAGVTLSGNTTVSRSLTVNGTLQLAGKAITSGNLQGSGTITSSGSSTLTTGSDNTSTTFSGVIGSGAIALIKNGTGVLTLSGLNTYTGATTVSVGILRATNNTIVASTNGAFGSNASGLILNGGTLQSNVGTFSRPITVTATNSGLDAYGAARTISSAINNATASSTYNLNIGGTTVTSAEGQNLILSGLISNSAGTLSLTKIGTSLLTLSAANTFSGGTTLSAGQLNINHAIAIGSGAFTINGGIIDNTATGQITLSNNNAQNWNGDFAFTGTQPLNMGTGAVTMSASRQITVSANTLTVGGTINQSTLNLTKAGAGSLSFVNQAITINNLTISAGTLISTSGGFNLAGNFSNSSIFTAGTGTVAFNGSSVQTISGSNTFNNLTVNNAAGVTAGTNQTVNGVLYLQSANVSATQGCLEMGTYTLTMGATATTTGTGDITGIVKRNSFVVNTPYSFGNQFTTLNLAAGGTLPTTVSVKIVLTTTHTWKTDAIHRYYDIIQTGSDAAAKGTLNLHYLDGELNGATENKLSLFDDLVGSPIDDHGQSNFNLTNNWVGLANLSLTYIAPGSFNTKYWTLGSSTTLNDCTWSGNALSNDWNDAGNWAGGIPVSTSDVFIPNVGSNPVPSLISTTIGSLTIFSGGTLNATTGSPTLTIADGSGAWENMGTFNPGTTSSIVFTNASPTMAGITNFYNVTVANGASLTLGTNNIMRIAGILSLSSTGVLNATNDNNKVEYNGTNQTVIIPNGSTTGYHDLILSGSGTKTMPSSAITVYGDFTMSGTATATAGAAMAITGNFNLTSGQFILNNATSYDITISGNFSQIGGLFDFNYGTSGTCNMYLGGNFTQTTGAGSMTTSGAGAPNGIIIFNGSGIQTMSFANPGGAIWVVYSVPTGKSVQLLSNIALNSANAVSQAGFQGEIRVNGTIDLGSSTVIQSGGVAGTAVFTLNSGASLITSNAGGISGAVSSTNMTNTFSSSANYEFRGAATGTFTTTPTANTVNNLTINGSSNVALSNSLNVAGLLLLTNGTFTLGGNTLIISGNTPSKTSGNIDASATNSTVSFAGSTSQSITSGTFYNNNVYNLNVNNSNNVILNGTLNLLNTLTTTSGKLDANTNSPTVSYAGTTAQTIEANQYLNGQINNLISDNASGVTLNTDLTVNNLLTVNSGKLYTISAGNQLNVAGTITNNAGTSGLLIKASSSAANGTLIFHNASGSPVSATVEMYSKASNPGTNYKWQFFGIPVRSMVASPTFDGSYVRQMYETGTTSAQHWVQLQNASTLTSFTGYEITQVSPTTITFQGNLENNDYASSKLSFTSGATYPGQHLIGNPYTAAIDISKIVFGDQMLKTVYLYNTGSLTDWTNKSADSTNTSNNNNTPGQYIAVPQANAGAAGLQSQIPSMQAFLVRAIKDDAAATVLIPYSSANTVVKNTNLQRARASEKICTIINVKGQRYGDCMWIFSDPYCSHNFDNGWDGEKFFGSALAPQIFAMEADGNYQVNSVNDMNNTDIGFWAGVDTSYTLTFTNQNFSLQYSNLYLNDLQENTITDITQSGTIYSFTALPTNSPVKRFKILTRPKNTDTSFESPNAENKQLKIFSSKQTIIVHNLSNVSGNLMLYDISGRCVQNKLFIANGVTTIPMNLPAGSYIAKGSTISEELTERLIIR